MRNRGARTREEKKGRARKRQLLYSTLDYKDTMIKPINGESRLAKWTKRGVFLSGNGLREWQGDCIYEVVDGMECRQ